MMRPVRSEAESNLTLRGASARLLRMMFVKLVRCGIAFALLIFVAAAPVRADVYAYTDEHGVLHLSDAPRDARYQLLIFPYFITPFGLSLSKPCCPSTSSGRTDWVCHELWKDQ